MIRKLQEKCTDYIVKVLTEKDCTDILELYKSNPDYFEIVESRPPNLEDCMNDLSECPPTFSKEKKFYLGFYRDEKLEAVVDFLMGFPVQETIYIGLFMIDGKKRARGLGRELISKIEEAAAQTGFNKLRLGVVSENRNAVRFWTKNGLKEIKRVMRACDNGSETEVIVMEKELENNESFRIVSK